MDVPRPMRRGLVNMEPGAFLHWLQMKRQVVLTVSESKRLIAKGVAALPEVRRAMEEGMVVVATGTTNAYVLEELWGREFDKRRYRSGVTAPKEPERHGEPRGGAHPRCGLQEGGVGRRVGQV